MPLTEPSPPTSWVCPDDTCTEAGVTKSGFAPVDAVVLCGVCATPCTGTAA